jgi:hypothetical protein
MFLRSETQPLYDCGKICIDVCFDQCATVPGRGPSAHGPGRQAFEARPALQAREARATGPRGLRLSQL